MGINTKTLFALLKEADSDKKAAGSNKLVIDELKNILNDTINIVKNITIEQAIKTILWQGILNEYGIYGRKTNEPRKFFKFNARIKKKEEYIFYHESFGRGTMLSVDFGTSNIGREFSLTHTGIVISDYPGLTIILPLTSQTDKQLDNLPEEIKNVIVPVYKKDDPQFENDSYILTHQIRSVSKNRITKIIGTIAKTKLMEQIEASFIISLRLNYP